MGVDDSDNFVTALSPDEEIVQFRKRQAEDLKRWGNNHESLRRRQPFHKRYDEAAIKANDTSSPSLYVEGDEEGEESWKDSEGQGLKDFGLDEEVEFYDEDDIPLGELIRRRQQSRGK
jgi:palmitoyltransferase